MIMKLGTSFKKLLHHFSFNNQLIHISNVNVTGYLATLVIFFMFSEIRIIETLKLMSRYDKFGLSRLGFKEYSVLRVRLC